jgi:hypothetical protein
MPPPVAQEAVTLENVEVGWWKRKEVGLVLGAGSALGFASSRFSLPNSSPEVGSRGGRVPPILSLEDSMRKTLIQYKENTMMWGFSGGGFSSRARSLMSWQIAVILRCPMSLACCMMLLRWLSLRVVSSLSLLWSSLCYAPRWGSGPRGKRIRLAFLSALDEEHFREDMLVG